MYKVEEFSLEKWERECILFQKNKKGLGFNVTFSLEDGKAVIKIDNCPEKYLGTLKNLALQCAQGAVVYLNHQFAAFYASEEDRNKENAENLEILHDNLEEFLKVLFHNGFDSFLDLVSTYVSLRRIKYELSQITIVDGKFELKDGSVWNGEFWEKNGKIFSNMISQSVWSSILPEKRNIA